MCKVKIFDPCTVHMCIFSLYYAYLGAHKLFSLKRLPLFLLGTAAGSEHDSEAPVTYESTL